MIEIDGGAYVVEIPTAYHDLGNWVKDGGAVAYDIEAAMNNANFEQSVPAEAFGCQASKIRINLKAILQPVISNKKINEDDILLGDGFFEREGAALLAGPSGIGKGSIAMQMGCCWCCGYDALFQLAGSQKSSSKS